MTRLKINWTTCGGCAALVRRAITAVDSRAMVEVDLGAKKVRV